MALKDVTSKDGMGVYASSDTLFKGAVFGRDSLEVAEDMMYLRPRLVEKIILTLAELQGEHSNRQTEEEHGKIVHEYRRAVVDGRPLDEASMHIFLQLTQIWGGDAESMTYFGSIDATPQFVRVVFKFTERYGERILSEQIYLRSGAKATLKQVVENSLSWIINKLDESKSGLLEYRRVNPRGIENQVWKDSVEFYTHLNGRLANHQRPIASVEVQGLAYDALIYASAYFPERTIEFNKRAAVLRDKTIELLWLEKNKYFALGTDYTASGKLRTIKTITANPASLLDSYFFEMLGEPIKQTYISAIVEMIMSNEFLTDAGIRSRSLSESGLVEFWDYHGSFTSWPKETYDIAKGLRRQGFERLAQELENRLLNVVRLLRSYSEFIYVDGRGRVLGASSSLNKHSELVVVQSTNRPEQIQAWTVSAIMAITADRRRLTLKPKRKKAKGGWQSELESSVLRHIPHVMHIKSNKALRARYPAYPYELQTKERP